jgi:hypothetical protein
MDFGPTAVSVNDETFDHETLSMVADLVHFARCR